MQNENHIQSRTAKRQEQAESNKIRDVNKLI